MVYVITFNIKLNIIRSISKKRIFVQLSYAINSNLGSSVATQNHPFHFRCLLLLRKMWQKWWTKPFIKKTQNCYLLVNSVGEIKTTLSKDFSKKSWNVGPYKYMGMSDFKVIDLVRPCLDRLFRRLNWNSSLKGDQGKAAQTPIVY